jgi:hypothetical protein
MSNTINDSVDDALSTAQFARVNTANRNNASRMTIPMKFIMPPFSYMSVDLT